MKNKAEGRTAASPSLHLLTGGIAGAVEATILYPTEFAKTQLQLQQRTPSGVAVGGMAKPFTGPIDCLVRVSRERGVLAIYQGLSTLVVGTFAKAAIRFYAYAKFANLFRDDQGQLTTRATMAAGMCAGMTEAVLAVTPTETVKTKLIQSKQSTGFVGGVRQIVLSEGWGGLYRGVVPTMLRQGCNSAIRFSVFGSMQTVWMSQQKKGGKKVGAAKSFFSGAVAGTVATIITMPIDVVKTRLQGANATGLYGNSTWRCFARVLRTEGWRALWRAGDSTEIGPDYILIPNEPSSNDCLPMIRLHYANGPNAVPTITIDDNTQRHSRFTEHRSLPALIQMAETCCGVDNVEELADNILQALKVKRLPGEEVSSTLVAAASLPQYYRMLTKELFERGDGCLADSVEFIDSYLTVIHLAQTDSAGRKHVLRLTGLQPALYGNHNHNQPLSVSCQSITYDLPSQLPVERLTTLTELFREFKRQVRRYQHVWDQLDFIDNAGLLLLTDDCSDNPPPCNNYPPAKPCKRGCLTRHITVKLDGDGDCSGSVEFEISLPSDYDPEGAVESTTITTIVPKIIKFHGLSADQLSAWRLQLDERLPAWPHQSGDLCARLEWLFGARLAKADYDQAYAVSAKILDGQEEDRCAICFDGLPPLIDDDEQADVASQRIDCICKQSYHCRCIIEWSRTRVSTRQSFRRVFTSCPNCERPLVIVAQPQSAEE